MRCQVSKGHQLEVQTGEGPSEGALASGPLEMTSLTQIPQEKHSFWRGVV